MTNAPIPADVKAYWDRITRGYVIGCTDEQYDAIVEYAARSAMADPKEACGVWHATHVVLKTPKCFCAKCAAAETFPVYRIGEGRIENSIEAPEAGLLSNLPHDA